MILGPHSVQKPGSARTSDSIAADLRAAPWTHVHVARGQPCRSEVDTAHRARVPPERDARSALRALEGRREPDPARARRRPLRDIPCTRRTLVLVREIRMASGGRTDGFGQLPDTPKVFDDVGEGTRASACLLRGPPDFVPHSGAGSVPPTGPIHAARTPRERGAAVFAAVDLERRELPASPTEDLRDRTQGFGNPVEGPRSRVRTRTRIRQGCRSSHRTARVIAMGPQETSVKTSWV
jgi:hypothetical protein